MSTPPNLSPILATAKSIKATLGLDPVVLSGYDVAVGVPRMRMLVSAGGFTVRAELNAKSLRKAIATIREHGPDAVACVLQGRLAVGDVLEDAGIAVQLKQPKEQAHPDLPGAAA